MKVNIFVSIAAVALGIAGLIAQRNGEKPRTQRDAVRANIDAITTMEAGEKGSDSGTVTNRPPEPWHYVPDYKMDVVKTIEKLPSAKQIKVSLDFQKWTISGEYSADAPCCVTIVTHECATPVIGSWCDQRKIGLQYVNVVFTEKE